MFPLVGISVGMSLAADSTENLSLKPLYANAVGAAGGAAVLIHLEQDEKVLRYVYERLDAIILSGGGDISPIYYRADPTGYCMEVDPLRDQVELLLARWAIEDNKPLLGICRGLQVLNVALGGTLYQDVQVEYGDELQHDQKMVGEGAHRAHEVAIEKSSLLYQAAGVQNGSLPVNSSHHQAIKELATGLKATSHASDGIIEAVEIPGKRFLLGVQWHPEGMYEQYPAQLSIFKALVSAAAG
jgi:putative glutamine amidotransferase